MSSDTLARKPSTTPLRSLLMAPDMTFADVSLGSRKFSDGKFLEGLSGSSAEAAELARPF